jgi:hypothetical protein
MDWEPDHLTIYRDGKAVWTLTDRNAIPSVAHHICIQLDAESDNALVAPVHMYVDFVRVWRRVSVATMSSPAETPIDTGRVSLQ